MFGVLSALYVFGYSVLAIMALLAGFGLVGIGVSQMIVAIAIAVIGTIYVSSRILKLQGKPRLSGGFDFFKPLGRATAKQSQH